MNVVDAGRRLATRRPGRDDPPRAPRRPRPALRAARPRSASSSTSSTSATAATTTGRSPAFDGRDRPGTRLVVARHVPVDDRRGPADRPARRAGPRAGRAVVVDGAQAAGAIPVDVEATRRRRLRGRRPRSGCSGRRGWARCGVRPDVADRCTPALRRLPPLRGHRLGGHRGLPAPTRGGSSGRDFHRPSVVGHRPQLGWLSMYVGLDWVHARGPATGPASRPTAGGDPRRDLLTPRRPDGDARDVPDRRLAGRGRRRRARLPRRSRSPHDRRARRAPDQRRLLHHRGRARAVRRGRRAAGGPHAGDAPAAPDAHDPGQR